MEIKNKNQKGIALITTIILTSVMLSSIVLITKEMADEVQNSTRLDNSLIAYYAAEAGIEDALLEFRYDHSAQISKENDAAKPTAVDVDCTNKNNCTPRTVNLSSNLPDYTTKAYNTSYYDLTMWNRTPCIITLANPTDPNSNGCQVIQPVKKDDTVEFVVPNMTQNVTLDWNWNSEIDTQNSGFRVEITVYEGDGEIIPAEGLLDQNGNQVTDSKSNYGGKFFTDPNTKTVTIRKTAVGSGKKIIRLKPTYVDKGSYNSITGSYSEGKSLPSGNIPSINLNINKNLPRDFITGLTTKIESVGYYGGVQREITAIVDRPSGNILNIFDYVIYSGSDLIK